MNESVFISYRRDGGQYAGRLLHMSLVERGYNVFFDVESMHHGKFDKQLYSKIEKCDNFILLLSKGALDRCSDEKDWVRREIEYAC